MADIPLLVLQQVRDGTVRPTDVAKRYKTSAAAVRKAVNALTAEAELRHEFALADLGLPLDFLDVRRCAPGLPRGHIRIDTSVGPFWITTDELERALADRRSPVEMACIMQHQRASNGLVLSVVWSLRAWGAPGQGGCFIQSNPPASDVEPVAVFQLGGRRAP